MMVIDNQLVSRKARRIEEDLERLSAYKDVSLEEYLADFDLRLKAERLLEKIVGRMIDINMHILKEERGVFAQDYYSSFVLLGEQGVINAELASKLAAASGLRNALAHEYDAIDDTAVYESMKSTLEQVPQYLKEILK